MVSRILALVVFCLVIGTVLRLTFYDTDDYLQAVTEEVPEDSMAHRGKQQFACRLPQLDPWDPKVAKLVDPDEDPFQKCKPTTAGISWLRGGKVVINETLLAAGVECQFRCNFRGEDEYTIDFGEWTNVSQVPECDIIEVRCTNESEVMYEFLHVQTFRRDVESNITSSTAGADEREDIRPPDVHIFVFDGVSSGEFFRSMLRTTHLLREQMDAVPFRFVNKLGINSHPNAYAMFMGKRNEPLEGSPMNDEMPPVKSRDAICDDYLDNETFVGYDFKRHGYATLWSEDWGDWSTFLYPDCKGFKEAPVDHYMQPFYVRIDSSKYKANKSINQFVYKRSCREGWEYQLEYLQSFLDSYERQPKWSLTWMNTATHDSSSGLYHVDGPFYKFLQDNKEKLANAFIFILGDHGYRHGDIRETKQGELEDNNPVAIVTVPERLRGNEHLINNLRRNARHLVTHYDHFATFHSILNNWRDMTPESSFAEQHGDLPEGLEFHGQSYLYPFDEAVPRTCSNQLVPFQYCICQYESVDRTKTNRALAERLAHFMVGRVNAALVTHNVTDLCATLSLDAAKPIELFEWEPSAQHNVYRVTFDTVPGGGRFWGYVSIDGNATDGHESYTLLTRRLSRLDTYGDKAFCASDSMAKSYCYCKELLETTSTIKKTSTSTTTPTSVTKSTVETTSMSTTRPTSTSSSTSS